jgi:hypothetical protein
MATESGPAGADIPGARPTEKRGNTVDTTESSAPHAHPSTEAHYACNDGWVTIGQLVVDPDTGEETEEYALYLCSKCAERS